MKNSKEFKCKACTKDVGFIDLRSLCTHCAFRIDTADSIASDINGIREDMYSVGIPTHGFIHSNISRIKGLKEWTIDELLRDVDDIDETVDIKGDEDEF